MTALKRRGTEASDAACSNCSTAMAKFQTSTGVRQRPCSYLKARNDQIIHNHHARCGSITKTRRPRMWIAQAGSQTKRQLNYSSDRLRSNNCITMEEKIAAECLSSLFLQGSPFSLASQSNTLTKRKIDSLQPESGTLYDSICLRGARCYRSPLKMNSFDGRQIKYYDDEDDDSIMSEDDDDEFVADSYDSSSSAISYTSTICTGRMTDKKKRMVNFERTVQVVEIANRRSFSLKQRQLMWNSNKVIRANVKRNRIEYEWEGWNWRSVVEEDQFSTNANGEKVHPVHVTVPTFTASTNFPLDETRMPMHMLQTQV